MTTIPVVERDFRDWLAQPAYAGVVDKNIESVHAGR